MYLKDYEVSKVLNDKSVVVYGAGKDGMEFYTKYKNDIDIKFFIDREKKQLDIPVVLFDDLCKNQLETKSVVICSRKYQEEIIETLNSSSLIGSKEIYVWQSDYSKELQEMIEHNYKVWARHKKNSKRKVIIPIENIHDGSAITFSYFANYFAEKYDASIYAFIRRGGSKFQPKIAQSVIDLYKSFNTEGLINIEEGVFDDVQVETIFQNILCKIHSMNDWEKIEINGFKCGISFMRDYLRFYELSLDPKSKEIKEALYAAIRKVLFWQKYIKENDICFVGLWDGAHEESYLRDMAILNNIPTYILHPLLIAKTKIDFNHGENFCNLKEFYNMLTEEQKKVGQEWAKADLAKVISGDNSAHMPYRKAFHFSIFKQGNARTSFLKKNDKVKILICPHIFNEDQWDNGWQICGNNFLSWLTFLGEISKRTDYDWYIKIHPDEDQRGLRFYSKFIEKFPNIELLASNISPWDLKKEGIQYALTIAGSIGHEYPLIGINVINAGNNPHISFGFNINAHTIEEYEEIIMSIEKYDALKNIDEIYEYYCIEYLYSKKNSFFYELNLIFNNLFSKFDSNSGKKYYENFLSMFSKDFHENIYEEIPKLIENIDEWNPNILNIVSRTEIDNNV